MIKYVITGLLVVLILYFLFVFYRQEGFENASKPIPELSNPFVHLYDDEGNKLNVVLISSGEYSSTLNSCSIFSGWTSQPI